MFNQKLSEEIFKELMNGRIINRYRLHNNGNETEDELFIEVMSNLDAYRQQYQMSGFQLLEHDDYLYIRDRSIAHDDLNSDITMKICVLLIVIGKFINHKGYVLGKITDPAGGLDEADIEAIAAMPDTAELLEKTGLKKGFKAAFISTLVERKLMLQKPSDGRFILAASGRSFFQQLMHNFEA